MPNKNPTDLATGSVDDFLLALADGIHKAQRQLSQVSIALQPGQPAITYQLPKVDFEFRVTFEMAAKGEGEDSGTAKETMRLRPAAPGPGRELSAQATSLIKGSFVAVPAQGGRPPPEMSVVLKRISGRRLQIEVYLLSAAGEKLEGIPVELNVDRDLSARLNAAQFGEKKKGLHPGTKVWDGLVKTDREGMAGTALVVDAEEEVGKSVAVLVDALSETQTVVFKVEADG